MINNFIAFSGASYIRGLTGSWLQTWCQPTLLGPRGPCAVHVLQYHEISVTWAQVAYWLDYSDVTCAPQCLKSPTTRLFLQQPAIKKTLKVRITGPYIWVDSTGDRWFLFTIKEPVTRKSTLIVMTSSSLIKLSVSPSLNYACLCVGSSDWLIGYLFLKASTYSLNGRLILINKYGNLWFIISRYRNFPPGILILDIGK